MRFSVVAPWLALALAIAGCGTRPLAKSEGHLVTEPPAAPATAQGSIPDVVRNVPLPPPPVARESEIKYSVVVTNQPVREVLLAMARETKVNFDIHPGIEGTVNLNAIDQTLKQILNRMAKQVDMRWESDGTTISVMPDTPYLRNYRVDYINMARDVNETVGIATQVISGSVAGSTGGTATSGAANNSTLTVNNVSKNRFWETLEKNVKDLLRETDKQLPEGSSETFVQNRSQGTTASSQTRSTAARPRSATAAARPAATETPGDTQNAQASDFVEQKLTFREAASVIVNPETGIVTVRATSRQHEKVQEFLENVVSSSRRQVMIEATIVEVSLNDNYQSGVDWSSIGLNGLGYTIRQGFTPPDLAGATNTLSTSSFSIGYSNPNAAAGGSIASTIKLLDTFGKTRVLSTPMLMVLNNQTAMLKVVDNQVYFTLKADTVTNQTTSTTTFTTTQNVVPVGFIMNVTPQISEGDMVTISVRPTVTRIIGTVLDPNPSLAAANVKSSIPITQTREMESVLKVASGQTAILGGLMLDSFDGRTTGLPVASRVPVVGDLFSQRNDQSTKTELVIFIRPLVVRNASMEGDLARYRRLEPGDDFFRDTRNFFPCVDKQLARLEDRARNAPCKVEPVPVVPDPPKASS
ncbi:MAG TPA: pilus (MSHA type) biogenesis protein MshL [Usitatibacter sp.]|nr:pilus (MSHA type) biogenesis protein MshL [Usitatibacter sp.]